MINDIRKILYIRLVKEFGPYKTWENSTFPSKDKKERYDKFLKRFADVVGGEWSIKDVQDQINYAISKRVIVVGYGNIEDFFQNKSIAEEFGFIDDRLLAKEVKCKY